tara:strand:- start:380 stop:601 length:222 start_codon:yes stop_codon:yes gene_type:complete
VKKKLAIRLLEEKLELHGNMVALGEFLDDPNNTREIDPRELELMYVQLKGMRDYYGALNSRAYFHANQKWPCA